MKDVPRATAKTVERNRPIVLLLPYITHTLSIRTTINVNSDEHPRMARSHVLSTHAKLTYPRIQFTGMNARSSTYKENGTYDAQVRGELINATHWLIWRLKQELDEPGDEAQWAYISILCQEDVSIYLKGTSLSHKTEYNRCNCPAALYLPYIPDFVGSMGMISKTNTRLPINASIL